MSVESPPGRRKQTCVCVATGIFVGMRCFFFFAGGELSVVLSQETFNLKRWDGGIFGPHAGAGDKDT